MVPSDSSTNGETEHEPELRVLIICENASASMGGEAILPLHYFRLLRERGVESWLVVHERVREELEQLLPNETSRIYYVRDTTFQRRAWRVGERLPKRVAVVTLFWLVALSTGLRQRRLARRLVAALRVNVVHQPTPVSPKIPSAIVGVDAPVIIGPMNGGMEWPEALAGVASRTERIAVSIGRQLSGLMNRLIPGKRRAALLLCANPRTAGALPKLGHKRVSELVENGVDLELWSQRTPLAVSVGPGAPETTGSSLAMTTSPGPSDAAPIFTYLGFLKDWKRVDVFIRAGARVFATRPVRLRIIGDGPEMGQLRELVQRLDMVAHVEFLGFIEQHECPGLLAQSRALVLPSVYECGGAVVLEAMSLCLPVIATAWGGPLDYLNADCGFLIEPVAEDQFVDAFASAMHSLADDPKLAAHMGRAGRARVEAQYGWDKKIDQILVHYRQVVRRNSKTELR